MSIALVVQVVIMASTFVVAITTLYKLLIKPIVEVVKRLDQAIDVIMGSSAVVDKRTGTVLVPARLSIMEIMHERFLRSEDATGALESRVTVLEDRVDELAELVDSEPML